MYTLKFRLIEFWKFMLPFVYENYTLCLMCGLFPVWLTKLESMYFKPLRE